MKELLINLSIIFKEIFTEWLPAFAKAEFGVLGEFLDAIGYIKYIIIAIVTVTTGVIFFIKRRN